MSLISDAGTPLLSDPGRLLVNQCIENKIKVIPIPGASSITTAMSVLDLKINFYFMVFYLKQKMNLKKYYHLISKFIFTNFFYSSIKNKFLFKKI